MSANKLSLEKKQSDPASDSASEKSQPVPAKEPVSAESAHGPDSAPEKISRSATRSEASAARVTPEPSPDSWQDSQTSRSEKTSPGEMSDNLPQPSSEPHAKDSSPTLGRFNACFDGLSKIGPLALLVALICMAWPIFWDPGTNVYCPAEIRSMTAFLHSVATGSWYAPTGLDNGTWSAAQWPVFTWCTALLALSPSLVASGYLLPTTCFLCTFFAVLGVWCLAASAGFGYRAAFSAALILLCIPIFAPLPNFVGPATISSGLFLFALVFFCRGWRRNASWFSLPTAFVLTALAGLAGGWLVFLVPLLGSFCFLLWQGTLRRAHRADAIFGYVLMLAIIGCWFGVVLMDSANNNAYLERLFDTSWRTDWISSKWFLPAVAGVLGTMPWLLMIFGVSWGRVFAHAGRTFAASRHSNASALVWICLGLSLPIAFFMPWFHPAAVAIACLVCVLLGKAAVKLGPAGSRFFYLLASLCLILAGCIILCASFESTQSFILNRLPALPVPDLGQKLLTLNALPYIGAIVLLGGILALMFVKRFSGCGPLIYGICLVIILCQPARLVLVEELAAMPGTPLVSFASIQAQVAQALAPASAQPQHQPPTLPAAPESAAPAPTAPPMEPLQPITPEVPQFKAPEPPMFKTPATPETIEPDSATDPQDILPPPSQTAPSPAGVPTPAPTESIPSQGEAPTPDSVPGEDVQPSPETGSGLPSDLPVPEIQPEPRSDIPASQDEIQAPTENSQPQP